MKAVNEEEGYVVKYLINEHKVDVTKLDQVSYECKWICYSSLDLIKSLAGYHIARKVGNKYIRQTCTISCSIKINIG